MASELERKLEEARKRLHEDEAAAAEAKKRFKATRAELERLEPQVKYEALRKHAVEIRRMPEGDAPGRAVHLALLVGEALDEIGDAQRIRFTLPIGNSAGSIDPDYYDASAEPMSVDEARLAFYVKVQWCFHSGEFDRIAKIFSTGEVMMNRKVDQRVLENTTTNLLTEDPEKWLAVLCRGRAERKAEEPASDEDDDDDDDE